MVRRTNLVIVILAVLAALVSLGCRDGGSGPGAREGWIEILRRIPAENRGPVAIVDFEAARRSGDGSILGTAEVEEFRDSFPSVARQAGLDPILSFPVLLTEYVILNGFVEAPPSDVRRVAVFGNSLAVQDGFEPSKVQDAVRDNPEIWQKGPIWV